MGMEEAVLLLFGPSFFVLLLRQDLVLLLSTLLALEDPVGCPQDKPIYGAAMITN